MNERDASFFNKERAGELIPIKGLRLITARQAIELGMETEGPIFISLAVGDKRLCIDCGIEFSALVYDIGTTVRAQHLHENPLKGGGIYYHLLRRDSLWLADFYGWISRVEPRGVVQDTIYQNEVVRSEEVTVLEIMALCMNNNCREMVDAGVAAFKPGWPSLFAYHEECISKEAIPKLYFKIPEGRPLFSQV